MFGNEGDVALAAIVGEFRGEAVGQDFRIFIGHLFAVHPRIHHLEVRGGDVDRVSIDRPLARKIERDGDAHVLDRHLHVEGEAEIAVFVEHHRQVACRIADEGDRAALPGIPGKKVDILRHRRSGKGKRGRSRHHRTKHPSSPLESAGQWHAGNVCSQRLSAEPACTCAKISTQTLAGEGWRDT